MCTEAIWYDADRSGSENLSQDGGAAGAKALDYVRVEDLAREAEQSQGEEGSGRGNQRGNKHQITWLLSYFF